jgi:hypothetical protein
MDINHVKNRERCIGKESKYHIQFNALKKEKK